MELGKLCLQCGWYHFQTHDKEEGFLLTLIDIKLNCGSLNTRFESDKSTCIITIISHNISIDVTVNENRAL